MSLGDKISRVAAPFWQFYVNQMSRMVSGQANSHFPCVQGVACWMETPYEFA
jgi:hypothetical protein